jgi:hypothetical protein
MEFVRQLWGNMGFTMPGMVTPTFNPTDLEKHIADLKAVEGWLRMNLSMLQMTIQGLEMQQTTLSTAKAIGKIIHSPGEGQAVADGDGNSPSVGETLQRAALWPLEIMQQMQEGLQKHLEEEASAASNRAESATAATAEAKPKAQAAAAKTAPRKPAKKTG